MAKKLTKKDLVAAYKELDKVVGVDPAIEHDALSLEKFEKELWETFTDLVEEDDKFSKTTEAVWEYLTEKYGEEEEEVDEEDDDAEEGDDDEEEEEEEAPPVKKGKGKTPPPPPPPPAPKKGKKKPEPEPEEEEEEEDEEPEPPKKEKKAKKEKEPKKEKSESASMIVRELVCRNPKITVVEIENILAAKKMIQSPISINIRKQEMIHAINIMTKLGKLK